MSRLSSLFERRDFDAISAGGFDLEPEAKKSATQTDGEGEGVADAQSAANAKPVWQPESVDRREDRIVLYGTFIPAEYVYHYRMKATSRGTFIVPPPYAESMYDPALKARGLAGSINVE